MRYKYQPNNAAIAFHENRKIYWFAWISSYFSILFSCSKWSCINASRLPELIAYDIHNINDDMMNKYTWSAHK
jgi:hypothetical protein